MEQLVGNYKSETGKDYYNIALNLADGDFVQIKNASCTAVAEKMALDYFNLDEHRLYDRNQIKVFFQNTCPELNLDFIPKKYHKYFK